jgi:hypothetical protein
MGLGTGKLVIGQTKCESLGERSRVGKVGAELERGGQGSMKDYLLALTKIHGLQMFYNSVG